MLAVDEGIYNFATTDGSNYIALKYDVYGTSYDGLLGRAWLVYDQNRNPVGLYDTYDFNSKAWADRSVANHLKTWGVRQASRFCDACSPYKLT